MSEKMETTREPKADPEDLALRARPRPIARINRRVLASVIGLGLLLLAGLVIVALDPPTWKPKDARPELVTGIRKPTADGLERLPSSYEGVPAQVTRPPAPVLSTVPQLQMPDPALEAERAEKARLMRLAIEARASPPFFRLQAKSTSTTSPPGGLPSPIASSAESAANTDLSALSTAATERLKAQLDGTAPSADATDQNRKLAFLKAGPEKEIYNPHGAQKPVSPYQLLAGTIIPASLVTGLNADLPGFVIAQVTEHVYDTVTGRHLLVPQGSRLIGRYDSVVAYGQERALVVWQRIIRPDGTSIVIDNLPATDTAGYAGLTDAVDLKTWRLLKGIGLATVLGVGSSLAFGQGSGDSDIIRALRESTGQTTNRAGQRLIERELNVQPTLTIRPGWPLRVIVHKDIVLTPVSP